MQRKIRFFILLFGVSASVLCGCAELERKNTGFLKGPTVLEPGGFFKFSDIPVPAGFKLLPQDSYSFESAGVRVGILKYQGKANPDQVVNFYKQQMPMYNWDLLNVTEYGERLLNFERNNETCIITLSVKGSQLTATIALGPKSTVSKKTREPVK